MLVLNRTAEALTPEERHLSTLPPFSVRTHIRPTDQRRGELTGDALAAFACSSISDEPEGDIPFSRVPPDAEIIPPSTCRSPFPLHPTQGDPTMHFKQHHQGHCVFQADPIDMAVLAVVLRHAAANPQLLDLTPTMPTTLESLAAAFELGTMVALQQTGYAPISAQTPLNAEAVQALCQRLVQEGVGVAHRVPYDATDPHAKDAQIE